MSTNISPWHDCKLIWMKKVGLQSQHFGALFIGSMREEYAGNNFSKAWIDGSTNHKTSNVTDHTCSEQHKSAMVLFHMDQAKSKHKPITTYSPIAWSVLSMAITPAVREQIK